MTSARPLPPLYPHAVIRFDGFVDDSAGPGACWPWLGATNKGQGVFKLDGRQVGAHRVAWKRAGFGEPADQLDHLCHDETCSAPCTHRRCCNPAHLRPATAATNNAPGRRRTKALRRRCSHGHSLSDAYVWRGSRRCRKCSRLADARRRPPASDRRGPAPALSPAQVVELRARRAATGASYRRLAAAAGVSPSTVHRLLTGGRR